MKSLLFSFLLLCSVTLLHAQQPGTLDPSFGDKGTLLYSSPIDVLGENVKIAKDGRILISTLGPYKGFAFTFKIDALLPDGSPDLSFGDSGSAYALFPGMTKPSDNAGISSLALLPDGRILAGGSLEASGNPNDIAFARFKPDGSLDSTFGTSGTATASFGYTYESAGSIALQPDGKIVSAGCISFGEFSAARFLPDGSKDLSFGNKGLVVGKDRGYANALALQEDGKIVVAGYTGIPNTSTTAFHVERYNTDGSYDNSFGTEGVVDGQINGTASVANDVAIQPDGKLVVAGKSNGVFSIRFTVVRYNADGSFDKSFGSGGVVITNFSQYVGEARKILITGEKGDKIVVAGTNYDNLSGIGDFAVVGYNTDGSLDPEFGSGGIELTDISEDDYLESAALQADGKIVALGYIFSNEAQDYYRALSRYYGYPQKVSLAVRIKRFLQNHGISWNGLPSEDKIAYYSVEQSKNSSKGFTTIAKVSGVSNVKEYNITNSSLLQGMNYYRVKAVSTDGVVRYSEVVSADNTASAASVFPNPARDYVTVQGLKANETASISIADGSGTIKVRGVSNGAAQYSTPLGSNMQPGTYYVNITTGSKTEVLKFVKE